MALVVDLVHLASWLLYCGVAVVATVVFHHALAGDDDSEDSGLRLFGWRVSAMLGLLWPATVPFGLFGYACYRFDRWLRSSSGRKVDSAA